MPRDIVTPESTAVFSECATACPINANFHLQASSRVAGSSASPPPRAEEELEAHTAMSATSTIAASSSFVTTAADGQARGDANVRQHGQRSEGGSRDRSESFASFCYRAVNVRVSSRLPVVS